MPVRPTTRPAAASEMLHPKDVASLVRLLMAIQRAAVDAIRWEEVSRLFAALSESFSGDHAAALRAVCEWIGDADVPGADAVFPLAGGSGDAADALRRIVAPAMTQAMKHASSQQSSAATEARVELCLEYCAQGMMTFSSDGTCLFLNRAATRLLKLPVGPDAGLVDRRVLHRAVRKVVEEFAAAPGASSDWLPAVVLEVGGKQVQCLPLVVARAGGVASEALLHLFLRAEAKSEELAARLCRLAPLSRQEETVARAVLDGKSYSVIATEMALSVHTVRTYVERVYEKLNVANRYELMKLVTSMGDSPLGMERER